MSRSSAIKRLMKELKDLQQDPPKDFVAYPLEEDIFVWHFSIRGPVDGGFSGGKYHGKIVFPHDYPMKPPNITFLNQTGRFEVGKKICLSITGYHPEHWHPIWGIQTAMIALIAFFPTKAEGAIAGLDSSLEERKRLALKSRTYFCDECKMKHEEILPDIPDGPTSSEPPTIFDENNNPVEITLSMSPTRPGTMNNTDVTPINRTELETDITLDEHSKPTANILNLPMSNNGSPLRPTVLEDTNDIDPLLKETEVSILTEIESNEEIKLNSIPKEISLIENIEEINEVPEEKEIINEEKNSKVELHSEEWHYELTKKAVQIAALRRQIKTLETESLFYLRIAQFSLVVALFAIVLYIQF